MNKTSYVYDGSVLSIIASFATLMLCLITFFSNGFILKHIFAGSVISFAVSLATYYVVDEIIYLTIKLVFFLIGEDKSDEVPVASIAAADVTPVALCKTTDGRLYWTGLKAAQRVRTIEQIQYGTGYVVRLENGKWLPEYMDHVYIDREDCSYH